MDVATAVSLAAATLAGRTAFTPEACEWAAAELASALGLGEAGQLRSSELPRPRTEPANVMFARPENDHPTLDASPDWRHGAGTERLKAPRTCSGRSERSFPDGEAELLGGMAARAVGHLHGEGECARCGGRAASWLFLSAGPAVEAKPRPGGSFPAATDQV